MFGLFRKNEKEKTNAGVAKERLQVIIASSRLNGDYSFMPELEREIVSLVRKYIEINDEDIDMKIEVDEVSGSKMMELNVNLPNGGEIKVK